MVFCHSKRKVSNILLDGKCLALEKQCAGHKGYSPEYFETRVSLRQSTCVTNLRTCLGSQQGLNPLIKGKCSPADRLVTNMFERT